MSVGAGPLVTPDFLGARTYRVLPIPALDIRQGENFAVSGLQASYTLLRSRGLTGGANARLRFGQKESNNRVALRGLGGVGAAAEVGGFLDYGAGPWSTRLTVAQDLAGGHGGVVGDLSASYATSLSRTAAGPVMLRAGPSLTIASKRFNTAYFGVDGSQSVRSGLAAYSPGGGVESTGVSATVIAPLSRRVTLIALGGYSRLLAAAADSPRVQLRGSADQVTAGLFLTYRLF